MTAVQGQTSGSNETSKGTSEHLEHEEGRETLAELVLGVPGAEEVNNTGEEDGFRHTEEDADDEETFITLNGGGKCADSSPDDGGRADVCIRKRKGQLNSDSQV